MSVAEGNSQPCWRVELATDLDRFRPVISAATAALAEARARTLLEDIAGQALPARLVRRPYMEHAAGVHQLADVPMLRAAGQTCRARRIARARVERELNGERS